MSPTQIIITIAAYFISLLIIAQITSRKTTNAGFFIGNKKSPWYVVAFGMIGASLSGVTFISVPGWVGSSNFSYLQMVLGYFLGYIAIAYILLPLYYKLNLTSIYTYLEQRFGNNSYKTGASFFLISRIIGASFRLFLVANVLQITIFESWNIPFSVTVAITILLIWMYTFRGGIKTIIWTDTLQTLFMLLAVIFSVYFIAKEMNLNLKELYSTVADSSFSKTFYFTEWKDANFFLKQFLSGAFITIVMTGLDQDMMQKNLSCRNLGDARKNVLWYGAAFIPVNILFLSLGVLLYVYAKNSGIAIPERSDDLFPLIATQGYLKPIVSLFFILGLIAAAYSSADSALTSLTTSFSIDILDINKKKHSDEQKVKIRKVVHVGVSIVLFFVILAFKIINNQAVVSAIFTAAGYTYGPLLGLYSFGLFTKWKVKDKFVPYIAVASPFISFGIKLLIEKLFTGYKVGFELLILNGLVTFILLRVIRKNED